MGKQFLSPYASNQNAVGAVQPFGMLVGGLLINDFAWAEISFSLKLSAIRAPFGDCTFYV